MMHKLLHIGRLVEYKGKSGRIIANTTINTKSFGIVCYDNTIDCLSVNKKQRYTFYTITFNFVLDSVVNVQILIDKNIFYSLPEKWQVQIFNKLSGCKISTIEFFVKTNNQLHPEIKRKLEKILLLK